MLAGQDLGPSDIRDHDRRKRVKVARCHYLLDRLFKSPQDAEVVTVPESCEFFLDTTYCMPYSMCYTVYYIYCTVYSMAIEAGIMENLRLELRRGCLTLAVLAELRREQYGYTLRKSLTDGGISIDGGTIYPLLRRLENQGLLLSEWREEEKRKKRFYRLSTDGEQAFNHLLEEWRSMNASLHRISAIGGSGLQESGVGGSASAARM